MFKIGFRLTPVNNVNYRSAAKVAEIFLRSVAKNL